MVGLHILGQRKTAEISWNTVRVWQWHTGKYVGSWQPVSEAQAWPHYKIWIKSQIYCLTKKIPSVEVVKAIIAEMFTKWNMIPSRSPLVTCAPTKTCNSEHIYYIYLLKCQKIYLLIKGKQYQLFFLSHAFRIHNSLLQYPKLWINL